MQDAHTASRLGQLVGVSADTLRIHERIGLLEGPERSPAGYGIYGDDAIARMHFIEGARASRPPVRGDR